LYLPWPCKLFNWSSSSLTLFLSVMHDGQYSSSSELVGGCGRTRLGHLPPTVGLATKSRLGFGIFLGVFVSVVLCAPEVLVSFCWFAVDYGATSVNSPCRVVWEDLNTGVVEFGIFHWTGVVDTGAFKTSCGVVREGLCNVGITFAVWQIDGVVGGSSELPCSISRVFWSWEIDNTLSGVALRNSFIVSCRRWTGFDGGGDELGR